MSCLIWSVTILAPNTSNGQARMNGIHIHNRMVYYYLLVFSCLLPFYFNQRKIILSKFYDIRDKRETESSNSSYQNQNWASLFIRKKNHCLHQCKWCVLGNCFHHALLILMINTFSFRQRNRYNIKIPRFLLFPPREIRCARGQPDRTDPATHSGIHPMYPLFFFSTSSLSFRPKFT